MSTDNLNGIGVLLEDMNNKIVGIGVLVEDMRDGLQAVSEAVSDLNTKVTRMDARLTSVEKDTKLIPVIIAVLKDHTKQLNNHAHRLTRLEARP